jgi:hypothetical protein
MGTVPLLSFLSSCLPTRDRFSRPRQMPVSYWSNIGDFECPFCADAEPTLKALRRALADTLLFAFRHFPLAEVHPYATHAT